jgi:D-alanine-D-alanine ligase
LAQNLKGKKIGVLMGGLSPEREVSLTTGQAVFEAIQRNGLEAVALDVDRDIAITLKQNKIDIAFIALHGTYGEDGTIQGILEYAKIPYTGAGVLGSSIAYDKVKSKEIFKFNNIPSADYQVFYRSQKKNPIRTLDLPVVVKPSTQGSSIGISIVKEESEWPKALELAFKYSEEVLVEKFIAGRLLAIGMNGEQPFPIVHIKPKSEFYDYESKYTQGKTDYICPAQLSAEEKSRSEDAAIKVVRALKSRGIPRVDAILDDQGTPYVLEINTIPGMTPTSLLPMAAKQAGMNFDELVMTILATAQLDN